MLFVYDESTVYHGRYMRCNPLIMVHIRYDSCDLDISYLIYGQRVDVHIYEHTLTVEFGARLNIKIFKIVGDCILNKGVRCVIDLLNQGQYNNVQHISIDNHSFKLVDQHAADYGYYIYQMI